ncbi:MAG: hypothetical protein ACI8TP_004924 [Acidimicrobiales bacterium]|jgi:hypothetical protein
MHFSVSTPAVLPVLPVRSDVDEPSELDVMLDVLLERFVLMSHYYTNLVCADGFRRVEVELLVDPDGRAYWAAIPEVGVAATGATPAAAALAAMRAATALV